MSTVQLDQALVDQMADQAVNYCAGRMFGGDKQQALRSLQQGRCDVCGLLSTQLVKQVGEYLGQVDKKVKAVYEFEPEVASLRPKVGIRPGIGPKQGINLVTWVDRKSAALTALGSALEISLGESRRKLGCRNATPACYTLGIHMVDDIDVQERRGYGVVVNSTYIRTSKVWPSTGQFEAGPTQELAETEALTLFDPEIVPEDCLFRQARLIEQLPEGERAGWVHRLHELKVSAIRRIISDQLAYINVAKEWFTFGDLERIYDHKIGYGPTGGKSAGMLLAARILEDVASEALRACVQVPESYFLGSDLMYIYMAMNGLMHCNNQKYKPEEQIRANIHGSARKFRLASFSGSLEDRGHTRKAGTHPLIVRSSSQLMIMSHISSAGNTIVTCANQGSRQNLSALTQAIASTLPAPQPDALLYRRSRGLQDYDERMAVLIQEVQGVRWKNWFLPFGSGVAFSRNLYRWAPQIRREDGFARLVWGLGTRAVERVGNDYPRLVPLSHPTLQPDDAPEAIRYYSQRYVDLIDLERNEFKTLPITDVIDATYPEIRFLVQIEQDGYLITPRSRVLASDLPRLAITFEHLLQRTPFAARLSEMLHLLEQHFLSPVDVEFTVHIPDPSAFPSEVRISVLQCRPQSSLKTTRPVALPEDLDPGDVVFSSYFMVPQGCLTDIRHVIFVPPEEYYALPSIAARNELGRVIRRLNAVLRPKSFICVGPGRWGTANPDLGVLVGYADICNAGALVELSGQDVGPAPEPSLGTHFFQDLMEATIYPVAINLDRDDTVFSRSFFYDTPNCLLDHIDVNADLAGSLRLIEVAAFRPGHHLELVMNDEKSHALAFLVRDAISVASK
jgi:hypothetical protein